MEWGRLMKLHADHSFAQKTQISAIWQLFRECYLAWSDVSRLDQNLVAYFF